LLSKFTVTSCYYHILISFLLQKLWKDIGPQSRSGFSGTLCTCEQPASFTSSVRKPWRSAYSIHSCCSCLWLTASRDQITAASKAYLTFKYVNLDGASCTCVKILLLIRQICIMLIKSLWMFSRVCIDIYSALMVLNNSSTELYVQWVMHEGRVLWKDG